MNDYGCAMWIRRSVWLSTDTQKCEKEEVIVFTAVNIEVGLLYSRKQLNKMTRVSEQRSD